MYSVRNSGCSVGCSPRQGASPIMFGPSLGAMLSAPVVKASSPGKNRKSLVKRKSPVKGKLPAKRSPLKNFDEKVTRQKKVTGEEEITSKSQVPCEA
uniref:Truncated neurofilament triplet H1-like protein n=1 Tax=Ranavirus ambystoma1 TaxID=265294 RepID=B1PXV2_9VIRU|nr:truncated neurofilament triplet H1-like protein [Ambystoma tigrinum virus]